MLKGVKGKVSDRKFLNKKGAIPIIAIIVVVIVAAAVGVVKINTLAEPPVMLSGSPDCPGPGCECDDGVDNDGDGLTDYEEEEDDCDGDPEADDECPSGQILFRIRELTNAHGAKAVYENYPLDYHTYIYSVCQHEEVTDPGNYVCDGTNGVIRLVIDPNNMNMHAEKIGQTNPNYEDICFDSFTCDYAVDCSTLPGLTYECFASLKPIDSNSPDTNMHLGRCESYPANEKLCCAYAPGFRMTPPPDMSPPNSPQFSPPGEVWLDVRPGIEYKQVPAGDRYDIVAETEFMERKLGNPVTSWTLHESYNGQEPYIPITSGGPIVDPVLFTVILDGSPGDTIQHRLEYSDGVTTVESKGGLVEVISPSDCENGMREYDEECDDGNSVPNDGCTNCITDSEYTCTRIYGETSVCTICGNGVCDAGEDHNNCAADCITYCGDAEIQEPNDEGYYEQCDDGNQFDDDGCNYPECQLEPGYECPTPGQQCTPFCGDLMVIEGEGCDDGGRCGGTGETCDISNPDPEEECDGGLLCEAVPNDGCTNCEEDDGWDCPLSGGPCSEYCGDSLIVGGEVCDSGNLAGQTCESQGFPGGGTLACSPNCFWFITSNCIGPECGDGSVDSPEECDPPGTIESCTQGEYIGSRTCNQMCMWDDCTAGFCGDGTVQNPPEECDPFASGSCPTGEACRPQGHSQECTCYTTSCFPAGTKVTMADNSKKNIEEIKIGEFVTSYDEKTKETKKERVTEIETPIRDHMCEIKFSDGTTLELTDEHPIYAKNNWVDNVRGLSNWRSIDPSKTKIESPTLKTSKLKINNEILLENGDYKTIEKITCWKEDVQTYNLKIANTQTYFAEDILVHNKPCFLGDTKIVTPEGSTEIQYLKVGDLVMSRNLETGELEPTKIVEVDEHTADEYLIINKGLKVTANHKMLINGEWQEIGKAKVGDKLSGSSNKEKAIYSIETVKERGVKVYNIELGENHNYFAKGLKEGLMAHNGIKQTASGAQTTKVGTTTQIQKEVADEFDVAVDDKKLGIKSIGSTTSLSPQSPIGKIRSWLSNWWDGLF